MQVHMESNSFKVLDGSLSRHLYNISSPRESSAGHGRRIPLLVQYIDLPNLLPYLCSTNLVTRDEYLQLRKKWADGYRQLAVMDLITVILPCKGAAWERRLMEALEASVQPECVDVHAGHEYVLQCVASEGRSWDISDGSELMQAVQEVYIYMRRDDCCLNCHPVITPNNSS